MVKKILLVLICLISSVIIVSTLHGQGSKKTIALSSGQMVWDLNGEWDVLVENYGKMAFAGNYFQIYKITQTGSSFVAIRTKDDPHNQKGSQSLQGELDRRGIKKVMVLADYGLIGTKGQISDDGNKIIIDDGELVRLTLTRK